jgi:hypothetical protein
MLACFLFVAFVAAQTAQRLPTTEGESLAGHKVVLPEAAKGKLAILLFGFTKASKTATSAWGDRIFSDFGAQTGFALYQLPVLESVPSFIRGMVISSMKKGVRENMRDHFIPVLRGEAELKQLVSYKEPDDAYLVMLDSTGQIVDQQHGPFSDAAYAQLRSEIQSRLGRQK